MASPTGTSDACGLKSLAGTRGGRARSADSGPVAPQHLAWGRLLALRERFEDLDLLPAREIVVVIAGGERGPQSQSELAALKVGARAASSRLRTLRW
jgi:hypothetical protein